MQSLLSRKKRSGVLAIFYYVDAAAEAVRGLVSQGYRGLTVYSPVLHHQLEEALARKTSPVRFFTLGGAVLGCLSGYALTVWTSLDWVIPLAGKPIVSIPPYIIIMFELTILLGALASFLGLILNARLPRLGGDVAYDARFSGDRIGIFVPCEKGKTIRLEEYFKKMGAEEIRFES